MKTVSHHVPGLLIMTLVIGIPSLGYLWIANNHPNTEWLLPSLVGLPVVFGFELNNHLKGKKLFWDEITLRDKLIFVLSYSFLLLCLSFLLAAKLRSFLTIFLIIGVYIVNWLLIKRFGSKPLKEKILWPNL
jgi:hypothetical protein